MKLNGSFFEIISAEKPEAQAEGAAPVQSSYRIRLNPGHEIYKAHFPEQPITPGVIIVRMAMELLSEALGRKAHLVGAPNIKFSSPLFPRVEAAPAMAPDAQAAAPAMAPEPASAQDAPTMAPDAQEVAPKPAAQSTGGAAGREVDFQITIKEGNMASVVVSDAETVFSKMLIRYE